jgi:putative methionine-R-sulfoxide reductase with GAF domain
MTPGESPRQQSLRYKVMTVFALTSLFPLLLFLLVLDRKGLLQDTDATLALGMSVMLTGLGFAFFLHTVRRIHALATDFLRFGRGELLELDPRGTAEEFAEIARIVQASHKLLADLHHSTHELQNLVHKLTTLSEITEVVSRLPDIQHMLQTVLHRTMAAVQSDIGSLMLLEERSQTLRIAAAEGHDDALIARTTVRVGEGIAGKVAQTGEAVLVDNVEHDPRFGKPNDPKYATASFICLPVRAHGRVIGVLNLSKKGERQGFNETDMKFLSTLLGYIGFAVDHARLVQEATTSAHLLQQVIHEKSSLLHYAQQQIQQTTASPAPPPLLLRQQTARTAVPDAEP